MRVLAAIVLLLAAPRDDSADSARRLLGEWQERARFVEKLRRDWSKLQARRTRVQDDLREADGDDKLAKRLRAIDEELADVDARLAAEEKKAADALDALGKMKSADAVEWIATEGLDRAKAPLARHTLAMAVARSRAAGPDALIAALGASKKPAMIVPLLQALARHAASGKAVPALAEFVRHKDWTVRVAAAFALARTARPEGVEPVVVALKSAEPHSREMRELAAALTMYTGQNHGPYPDVWWKWWQAERRNVLEGRIPLGKGARHAKAPGDQDRFYGIPQVEPRIIYVIDVSGSMQVSMKNPQWVDGKAVPARDDEDSRFDAARRELLRAMRKLRPKTTFAVVLYSSHVRPLAGELEPATDGNRARVEKELAYTGPSGSTNIYAAMDHALRLAGVHPEVRGAKQAADAIYLLSDGAPTNSKGETEDPERTLQAVRRWNALGEVAIHTIGIGREHSRGFLEALAEQNGGRYYAVR